MILKCFQTEMKKMQIKMLKKEDVLNYFGYNAELISEKIREYLGDQHE